MIQMNVPGGYCLPTNLRSNTKNPSKLPTRPLPRKSQCERPGASDPHNVPEIQPQIESSCVLGFAHHKYIQSTSKDHAGMPEEEALIGLLDRTKVPLENDQLPDEMAYHNNLKNSTSDTPLIEQSDKEGSTSRKCLLAGKSEGDHSSKHNKRGSWNTTTDLRYFP